MTEGKGSYQVLARRFRPVEFGDVVGQEEVLASLRSSLEQGRLPHALLFSGSRGVGKTTTARILARAVNCEVSPGPSPCGTCLACTSILDGSASDVIELDAASNNGVEEVRALREQAGYAPIRLRKKVFILDEVHMFSRAAFNALLKILEEPPEHVLFILATTEAHKIPETVRSRCQVLPFRRIGAQDIEGRLAAICAREGVTAAPDVLAEIAASSMGGLRDAETSLERILPLATELDLESYRRLVGRLGPSRAAELLEACFGGDMRAALHYASEAVETGVDERECLGEVLEVLRAVLLLLVDGEDSVLVEAGGAWRTRLQSLAQQSDVELVDAMMQLIVLARDRIRHLDDRRVLLELTLVRLARVGGASSLGELVSGAAPMRAPKPSGPPSTGERASRERGSTENPSAAAPAPTPAPAPAARRPEPPNASASLTTESEPAKKSAGKTPRAKPHKDGDPWVRTVELAIAERERLGHVLSDAKLVWDGDAQLSLVFGKQKAIDRALVTAEKNRVWIEETFSGFAGRSVRIEVETTVAKPAARSTKPKVEPTKPAGKKTQPAVEPDDLPPLGRKAAQLFDVQHVEREEETGA